MKYFWACTIFLGLTATVAGAQNSDLPPEAPIRNPFLPQLPEKPKVVETPPDTRPTPGQNPVKGQEDDDPPRQTPRQTPNQSVDSGTREVPIPKPNFRITGILWNSPRPQAIINGQVLDVGDEIEGFRIESIRPSGIDVSIRGVTLTVEP